MQAAHDRWVADFNFQAHWTHRQRDDGRHSPAEVLGWVHGRVSTPADLHRTFYTTRFRRLLDRHGYVRFRNWRMYGEPGLPGQAAVVSLYGETLTVGFGDTPLAQYRVQAPARSPAVAQRGRSTCVCYAVYLATITIVVYG